MTRCNRDVNARRRNATLFVSVAFFLGVIAPIAEAKCCELNHIVIGETMRLDREVLADRLSDSSLYLLYGPVLYGTGKGDMRPQGNLGPRYEVTYVVEEIKGDPTVRFHESVFPLADPPTAFAPRGQRFDLGDGYGPRRVPWGWRPFPKEAATVIALWAERRAEPGTDADAPPQPAQIDVFAPTADRPGLVWGIKLAGVVAGGLLLLIALLVMRVRARPKGAVGP
jgi:hypothetical protein